MRGRAKKKRGAILVLSALLCGSVLAAEVQPAPKSDAPPPPAKTQAERTLRVRARKSLVLSFGGGPVYLSAWDAASTNNQWLYPEAALQSLAGSNNLALSLKPATGAGFGLGLAYGLSPRLDIQFRIDIIANRSISDGQNEYTLTWKWLAIPSSYSLDPSPIWPITGYLRANPVSLSLVARFPAGSRLQPYLHAGVAYFLVRFKAESQIGYARTWVQGTSQYVDYYALPVNIDAFFNGVGFTGGAGLEWILGPKTAVFFQADYFTGPSHVVGWEVKPGTYSAFFSSTPLRIDENYARAIRNYISPFTVKIGPLSRLLAGFKILL